MKRVLWVLVVVLLVRVLILASVKRTDSGHAKISEAHESTNSSISVSKTPILRSSFEVKSTALHFPTRAEYVAQAKLNPHHAPPVVSEFAGQMADQMEIALSSESQGVLFFKKLENCAMDSSPDSLPQFRAICAVNAARLAQKYPDLLDRRSSEMRASLSSTSPETFRLVRATE